MRHSKAPIFKKAFKAVEEAETIYPLGVTIKSWRLYHGDKLISVVSEFDRGYSLGENKSPFATFYDNVTYEGESSNYLIIFGNGTTWVVDEIEPLFPQMSGLASGREYGE